jgi:hypothetical protein
VRVRTYIETCHVPQATKLGWDISGQPIISCSNEARYIVLFSQKSFERDERQNLKMSLTDVKDSQAGKSPKLGWQATHESIVPCSMKKEGQKSTS